MIEPRFCALSLAATPRGFLHMADIGVSSSSSSCNPPFFTAKCSTHSRELATYLKTAPWGENMNLSASRAGAGSMADESRAGLGQDAASSGRKLMLPPSSAWMSKSQVKTS